MRSSIDWFWYPSKHLQRSCLLPPPLSRLERDLSAAQAHWSATKGFILRTEDVVPDESVQILQLSVGEGTNPNSLGAFSPQIKQTGNESATVRRLNSRVMSCRCADWGCSTGEAERGGRGPEATGNDDRSNQLMGCRRGWSGELVQVTRWQVEEAQWQTSHRDTLCPSSFSNLFKLGSPRSPLNFLNVFQLFQVTIAFRFSFQSFFLLFYAHPKFLTSCRVQRILWPLFSPTVSCDRSGFIPFKPQLMMNELNVPGAQTCAAPWDSSQPAKRSLGLIPYS